jgi:hypothetical protein
VTLEFFIDEGDNIGAARAVRRRHVRAEMWSAGQRQRS